MITTITGKNQVTIPAQLVKQLDLEPGTQLDWNVNAEGVIFVRPLPRRNELVSKLEGMGRAWLKPGQDPIADLINERVEDDILEGLA